MRDDVLAGFPICLWITPGLCPTGCRVDKVKMTAKMVFFLNFQGFFRLKYSEFNWLKW